MNFGENLAIILIAIGASCGIASFITLILSSKILERMEKQVTTMEERLNKLKEDDNES